MGNFNEEVDRATKDFVRTIDDRRARQQQVVSQPASVKFMGFGPGLDSGELPRKAGVQVSSDPPPPQKTASGHYSFEGVNASEGDSALLLIYDGLVGTPSDQEVPSGMGSDDYTIGVSDGDEVYVEITYDTGTFEITSRDIGVGSTPDEEFGYLAIKIMDVAVTTDDDGNATVFPTNARCGDLIFTFDSGALNGVPAIKLTPYGDWQEIE